MRLCVMPQSGRVTPLRLYARHFGPRVPENVCSTKIASFAPETNTHHNLEDAILRDSPQCPKCISPMSMRNLNGN